MKNGIKLWLSFALNVIVIMFVMISITGALAFKLISLDMDRGPAHLLPPITLLITAILVSTSLILLVSKHLLVPIQNLIEALQKVAGGDFTIRLPENHEDAYAYNMNANFNKMVRELNSMEMLQSDFIQNVSHEFKTPLASIEGYATLLNGAALPGELNVYSRHILESARQLSVLTGNILKLSKLENQGIRHLSDNDPGFIIRIWLCQYLPFGKAVCSWFVCFDLSHPAGFQPPGVVDHDLRVYSEFLE